ncbi:Sulfotransferase family protein [Tindallia magadiensis]|uniref:Sulfotransferase family protein n=1 Tax=Tindallia magadiensis TaxID=69895 RepID=A0A1I3D396_9FIRM|nr:sulfotransferase [Tindallia magadiensis]SFH81254.1 Sulfotransferase family protein [Tindallia magadiensis]
MQKTFDSQPIFIGGDGRSGTTLLSVILDSHPELAVGPELHFNGPENLGEYVEDCLELLIAEDPRVFGKGLKENKHYKLGTQFAKRCHRFGLEFDELRELIINLKNQTNISFAKFEERCVLVNAIGEKIANKRRKKTWGIKIMREIKGLSKYGKIWPNAHFIHIIRDGRDVTASQMKEHETWGYGDVQEAAKSWVSIIEKARKNGRAYNYYEIKYEDIVLRPEDTLKQLMKEMSLPWDDALLKHNEIDHSIYKNPYNHASIDSIVKPINESAVGRHKRDLTIEQIQAFNKIARKMLKELRYEVE